MYGKLKVLAVVAFVLIASLSSAFAEEYASYKCWLEKYEKAKMEKVDWEKKFYYKTYYILTHDKELELTDDQAGKIKELEYRVKRSATLKDAEVEALVLDIHEALGKDEAKAEAIYTLIDKKYELKKEKAKELVAAYLDLRALLTKSQYSKLKALWCEYAKEKDKK